MNQKDPIGNIIIAILFILLAIAGVISYKSIDWNVLKRMEQVPLVLPTPIPTSIATQSAQITPTSTATSPATKK